MKKPELLAPAGNLEKLKIAVKFGADAIYFGNSSFSLRSPARGFKKDDLKEGIDYCREHDVRSYITVNIYARNENIEDLQNYIRELNEMKPDGIIISDPGLIDYVRDNFPQMEIHLSTQANVTNYLSARHYHKLGVSRVNLARELSLEEMNWIKKENPDLELEVFIHGALCIAYSGRCFMSRYMNGRDANQGLCTQSCRWEYTVKEEKRPDEEFDITEDEHGSYVMNSKDLNLIDHMGELISMGIDSFKIEGRMKSVNYVAGTVRAYRRAIDEAYVACVKGEEWKATDWYYKELDRVTHREYTHGFIHGENQDTISPHKGYIADADLVGIVVNCRGDGPYSIEVKTKNKVKNGDEINLVTTTDAPEYFIINKLTNTSGAPIEQANVNHNFMFESDFPLAENDLLRIIRK